MESASEFICSPQTKLRKDLEFFGEFALSLSPVPVSPKAAKINMLTEVSTSSHSCPTKIPPITNLAVGKSGNTHNHNAQHSATGNLSTINKTRLRFSTQNGNSRREDRLQGEKRRQKLQRSQLLMNKRNVIIFEEKQSEAQTPIKLFNSKSVYKGTSTSNRDGPDGHFGDFGPFKSESKVGTTLINCSAASLQEKDEQDGGNIKCPKAKIVARNRNKRLIRMNRQELKANTKAEEAGSSKLGFAYSAPASATFAEFEPQPLVARNSGKSFSKIPVKIKIPCHEVSVVSVSRNLKACETPAPTQQKQNINYNYDFSQGQEEQNPQEDDFILMQNRIKMNNPSPVSVNTAKREMPKVSVSQVQVQVMKMNQKQEQLLSSSHSSNSSSSSSSSPAVALPGLSTSGTIISAAKTKTIKFDSHYMEFNENLVWVSRKLVNIVNYCEKLLNQIEIPKEVLGDVRSIRGQSALFISSSLAHFALLLSKYLTCAKEPHLIRLCDLWGVWDSLSVQVDKLHGLFNTLLDFEKNGWNLSLHSERDLECPENRMTDRDGFTLGIVKANRAIKAKKKKQIAIPESANYKTNKKTVASEKSRLHLRTYLIRWVFILFCII